MWLRHRRNWLRTVVAIVFAASLVLLVAACNGGKPTTTPPITPTIKLVEGGWETLSINNAIAKFIIEHGYDYLVEMVVATPEG